MFFLPIALTLASALLIAFYNFHWKRRKLPPGPTPWPLLGNLMSVAKDKSGYRIFRQWADLFGPVFTVWWAEEPYILIADYSLMKEAYVKHADAFSGRHILPISDILSKANHSAGVARINGESWRELRKFSMKVLRDLGVGRNGMQERILPTVKAIMRKLDTDMSNGLTDFNMLPFLNFFTANVINELTFATGFDGDKHHHYEQLMHLSETIHSNFTSLSGLLLALIPVLRHFPIFKRTYNKMNGPWEAFHAYFEQGIQQRIAFRQSLSAPGTRKLSVFRKRSGGSFGASFAIRKRSGSGGGGGNRSRDASLENRKGAGGGVVKKMSGGMLAQIRNGLAGMKNAARKQSQEKQQAEGGGGGIGVFQQPIRKFSSTAVGRKVSRVQWTVMVEREQTPSECFVDLFLDKLDQQGGPDKFLNMDALRGMCFDLFVGGQEPTASTLGFMIIYLLLDQQRQRKLHAELDAFAAEQGWNGEWEDDEWIELADRPKLPYMNAVINETQRIANLLPMNLTHMTTCDTQIGDHPIPKGIAVIAQMSALFCDPKLFPEPEKFIPERFIDENGQLKKCDELIPFSLGKRNCIGEGLARAELFLFSSNFFNKFQVLPTDPLRPPTIEKKVYFTSMPLPFRCSLVRRRHQLPSPPWTPLFKNNNMANNSGGGEPTHPASPPGGYSPSSTSDDEVPVFPVLAPPPKKKWAEKEETEAEIEKEKKKGMKKEEKIGNKEEEGMKKDKEGKMWKEEGKEKEKMKNEGMKMGKKQEEEEMKKEEKREKKKEEGDGNGGLKRRKSGVYTPQQHNPQQQQMMMAAAAAMGN